MPTHIKDNILNPSLTQNVLTTIGELDVKTFEMIFHLSNDFIVDDASMCGNK